MASKTFEELALAKNPLYQRIIDMKAREEAEKAQKELSIKYIGCKDSENKTDIELTFEVTAKNLDKNKANEARIFIPGISTTSFMQPSYAINPNGQNRITITVSQYMVLPYMEFVELKAFVLCDGLSAESEKFELKCAATDKTPETTCLCKKTTWTADDLKYIVTELRKREILKKDARNIRNEKKEIIGKEDLTLYNDKINEEEEEIKDKIFYLNRTEKLDAKYINYSEFSKQLNRVFREYKIDTCLRKIHFIAQIYQETNRFRATYEEVATEYSGGNFYQGRGMKQITHDYNYLEYYCFINKSNLFNIYIKNRKDIYESVTNFNKRTNNQHISIENMKKVDELVSKISTDMYYACDSAGWYWWKNKIYEYADKDDIIGVSAKVNNPSAANTTSIDKINGYEDRHKFYLYLKEIFDYENCK